METKIILTDEQIAVIEKEIKGEYSPFHSSKEETAALQQVIADAEKLAAELDAYDEIESLVAWYYEKYKEQQ